MTDEELEGWRAWNEVKPGRKIGKRSFAFVDPGWIRILVNFKILE